MRIIQNMHLPFISTVGVAVCFSIAVYGNFRTRTPLKFDEFGLIPCGDEIARIDNYGRALREQSDGLAAVVIYAGRTDTRIGEVFARLFAIRDRLRSAGSIDGNRIVILDGGAREKLEVQLWILPADSREASTMLCDSQIASQDVRLRSPRIDKWGYTCRGAC